MTTYEDEHRPLGRGLEGLADGAAAAFAAGRSLDLATVRASARRRRTRFEAGAGGVAVAIVAVTLLAAGALPGPDGGAPPAQTTPSPTVEQDEVTPAPGSDVACGTHLDDLPAQPDGVPEVSLEATIAEPTVRVGDPVEALVTTTMVTDTSLPHGYTFSVWLARDGVVVGHPELGWADEVRPSGSGDDVSVEEHVVRARFLECSGDGATPIAAGGSADFDLVAVMVVQVGDGPVSAPYLSNLVVVHVVEGSPGQGGQDDAGGTDDAEWLERFAGDEGWSDVDPAAVPGDLPLVLGEGDRILRSQAYEDGLRWRTTVSNIGGRDTYDRVRNALVAAGYEVQDERTDPDRPFGNAGTFTRGTVVVHVDTSNETGEGFSTDLWVETSR